MNAAAREELLRAAFKSGRLRHTSIGVLHRAASLIVGNRSVYPPDPVEALVQAVATIEVMAVAGRQ